jgi:hypothetical protein
VHACGPCCRRFAEESAARGNLASTILNPAMMRQMEALQPDKKVIECDICGVKADHFWCWHPRWFCVRTKSGKLVESPASNGLSVNSAGRRGMRETSALSRRAR